MSKRPSTADHDPSVTEPGDGDPFLSRWARRKSVARAGGDPEVQLREKPADGDMPATAAPAADEQHPPVELTDEDMPAVDTIDEGTDMSGFFSPKVTEAVKKAALRKFFHSPAFNFVDGLDDYDEDFRNFAPLGDIVTSDMRSQIERKAEAAKERLSEDGQVGDESEDGRGRAKHDCGDAGDRAVHGENPEDARAGTPAAKTPPAERADRADESSEAVDGDSARRPSAAKEPDAPGVTREPGSAARAGPGKLRPKGAADNDA